MTKDKLIDTLLYYNFYAQIRSNNDQDKFYQKIIDMVNTIIPLIYEQNKIEKGMRWLGFIQGMLYMNGNFTIQKRIPSDFADALFEEDNMDLKKYIIIF